MANELLDFVLAVVRDPEVAARYTANPDQAIADAQLAGVSSADVDNLIPMVSDSLSMAAPDNVWTSGAATAAFDAFIPQVSEAAAGVIQDPADSVIDAAGYHDVEPGQFTAAADGLVAAVQDPAPVGFDDPVTPPATEFGHGLPDGFDDLDDIPESPNHGLGFFG